ncbi:MAG TPA: saccharopine dehydrogenase NADP-binding domain-containing protein [Alphaproteobacteria bacterium]|nr:saccharopine dehydrogenase NADP-binding domain-containing protein [Alphaproteobacteria bacterium]
MKAVVIGGSGRFGRATASFLAADRLVSRLIVAGRERAKAQAYAGRLGPKAAGASVEVHDAPSLDHLLADADIVVNASGPYLDTLSPVLEAAIRTRTHYVDFAEDARAVERALALDAQARASGVTALVGFGGAPGITNLLAVHAARQLDSVDRIQVGWVADIEALLGPIQTILDDMRGGRVNAAIQSILSYAAGSARVLREGRWCEIAAFAEGEGEPVALTEGIEVVAYPIAAAEPLMLHRHLPAVRSIVSLMSLIPPQVNDLLRAQAAPLAGGAISAEQAAIALFEALARNPDRWLARPKEMFKGAKFAVARGVKDARPARYACAPNWRCRAPDATIERPDTGAVAALAALKVMAGDIAQRGVLLPEACFEPLPFFAELDARWGAPRDGPLLKERFDWLDGR